MFAHRFRYVYILLLAAYSFLNILFIGGDGLFNFPISQYHLFAIILMMVFLVWESNRLLFRVLQKNSYYFKGKSNILVLFFVISFLHVGLISAAVAFWVPGWLGMELAEPGTQFKLSLAFSFRINLFLHTIHAIMYYDSRLKNSMLESEKLKTLTAESQFEALRNQVKPHFLFNSFNVLSGLVHKNPNLASEFIQQLSKVYRYLLYHQQEKMVSLKTELDYLNAYIFLLQIRFGGAFRVNIQVDSQFMDGFLIPPASLQLLVENAVKHNKVSKKDKLEVNIFVQNRFLVIHNNLQRKKRQEASSGLGLENIKMRYQHLAKKEIIVEQNEQFFTVRLPLILQPEYESPDR